MTPSNNAYPIYLEPEQIMKDLPGSRAHLEVLEFQPLRWMATMNKGKGAGFHSSVWGPVPYQFGAVPTERYALVWVDVPGVAPSR